MAATNQKALEIKVRKSLIHIVNGCKGSLRNGWEMYGRRGTGA